MMQSSRVSCTISMMVFTPRPSSPTRWHHAPRYSISRGCVRLVAELVLKSLDLDAVPLAIRPPARREEAGEPAFGVGQRQERIRHRRRAEPLVPDEFVRAVGLPRRARGVGAHVRAALLFRHRHAHGDGAFFRQRERIARRRSHSSRAASTPPPPKARREVRARPHSSSTSDSTRRSRPLPSGRAALRAARVRPASRSTRRPRRRR